MWRVLRWIRLLAGAAAAAAAVEVPTGAGAADSEVPAYLCLIERVWRKGASRSVHARSAPTKQGRRRAARGYASHGVRRVSISPPQFRPNKVKAKLKVKYDGSCGTVFQVKRGKWEVISFDRLGPFACRDPMHARILSSSAKKATRIRAG